MDGRRYTRAECWVTNPRADLASALAVGTGYVRTWYLEDGRAGLVESYGPGGLEHVSYREVLPPYDDLLADHRRRHPDVSCSFWAPPVQADGGLSLVRTRHHTCYATTGEEEADDLDEYTDAVGRPVRTVRLGPSGELVEEMRYVYRWDGDLGLTQVFDPSGQLLYECDPYK